jgi:hypothetical protein
VQQLDAPRMHPAIADGGPHRAVRLGAMLAVVEPARPEEWPQLGESVLDFVGAEMSEPELLHAGRVDD